MPRHPKATEEVANENTAVVAPNTVKPLTEQFREIMLTRKEESEAIAQKKLARYNERQVAIQPLWDEVIRKTDEMMYTVHRAYEPSWGRLLDFLMRLNDALAKQGPLMTSQLIDDYLTPAASIAVGAVGGLAGRLVGGVGTLFGVGDGAELTARRVSKFVVGAPNDDIQYFVDMDENNELRYWLKRSDGQELTDAEQTGYMAEIGCWLKGLGYVEGGMPFTYVPSEGSDLDGLNSDVFAQLRDDEDAGLANYFSQVKAKLELEPAFDKVSEAVIDQDHCFTPRA